MCERDELSGIVCWLRVLQYDIVTRLFCLESYLAPAHPYEWMEPVEGAHAARKHLDGPVMSSEVRELVYQRTFKIALAPGCRLPGQQHGRTREPERYWTGEAIRQPDVDLPDPHMFREFL